MLDLKRLLAGIILILVSSLVLITDEVTIPQKEEQDITIQGQVLDVNTLKPIPDTNITIIFTYTEIKSDKTASFSKGAKTNEQGLYAIKNISSDFLNKEKYRVYLQFNLQGNECPNTIYNSQDIFTSDNNWSNKTTIDFKMLKPTDELTICGKAVDIADASPLSKINVKVKLLEREKGKSTTEKGKENTLDTIEHKTDAGGAYKTKKVSADYCPFLLSKKAQKYAQVYIDHFEYVTKSNPVIETIKTAQEIKHTINFALWNYDFHIINPGKGGSLNGVLLDVKGNPMVKVPITVNFGERNK